MCVCVVVFVFECACVCVQGSVVTACGHGLIISIEKTKFLVVGSYVVQSDVDPIVVGSDFITSVASFSYLGSLLESHG